MEAPSTSYPPPSRYIQTPLVTDCDSRTSSKTIISTTKIIYPNPPPGPQTMFRALHSSIQDPVGREGDQRCEQLPSNSNPSSDLELFNNHPKSTTKFPELSQLLVFLALGLSMFMAALDTVLIPTALPTISQDFHIADSLYAWVGSSYLLANASSVPFWGKLSDIFGRKSVILIANAIFLVGSIICAVAVNAAMLIAGRIVQGIGGGGVIVLVHVCVSDLFTIRDRSLYMGILGGIWAVASALGPVLGGIFSDKLDWRYCFYINIPIVVFSIIVLHFKLNVPSPKVDLFEGLASMDWLGTVTILVATVLFLVGLQLGGSGSYGSPLVIVFLTLGCVAYFGFAFTQWWTGKRGGTPIMPLRIFNDMSNLCSMAVCACDALVFNSIAYFLPLYFQIVLGKSPSIAGIYMLAIAVPLATISIASGHLIEITGRFLEVLQAGLLLMTLGVGLLISLGPSPSVAKIVGILIVVGIGFGPNFGAPLIALQTRIRESDIATGTAAFSFVRMVFGAIGLVVGQVVFQSLMRPTSEDLLDVGISEELAHALHSGDAISRAFAVGDLPPRQRAVARSSLTNAFRGTWIFFAVVAALGMLVSFGIKRTKLRRELPPRRGENSMSVVGTEDISASIATSSSSREESLDIEEKHSSMAQGRVRRAEDDDRSSN
ncbi:hypothetical protein J1614_003257 [Plenodomus biglobosus]|nr:hypothetical protein J1614_003257 [Plenodomus biglobosus]